VPTAKTTQAQQARPDVLGVLGVLPDVQTVRKGLFVHNENLQTKLWGGIAAQTTVHWRAFIMQAPLEQHADNLQAHTCLSNLKLRRETLTQHMQESECTHDQTNPIGKAGSLEASNTPRSCEEENTRD
jgi:hypothetical protein